MELRATPQAAVTKGRFHLTLRKRLGVRAVLAAAALVVALRETARFQASFGERQVPRTRWTVATLSEPRSRSPVVERLGPAGRILTSLEINASVGEVWSVLTDYASLERVVPNLVHNEVLAYRKGDGGAVIWQVGQVGLHVPGTASSVYIEAGCILNVSLYPRGLPPSSLHQSSPGSRKPVPAERGVFCQLPEPEEADGEVRHITMQNVEGTKGGFRNYQGLWTLSSRGKKRMRLSYSAEVEPHWFLPVLPIHQLAMALQENLESIREFIEGRASHTASGRRRGKDEDILERSANLALLD